MKKTNKMISIIQKNFINTLTVVLKTAANSSSCFNIGQPKEPKGIKKFKRFK